MVGQCRGRWLPIRFLFCWLVLLPALLLPAMASGQEKVSFDRQIRSILSNNCYQCHGPDEKARQARFLARRGFSSEHVENALEQRL